MRIAINGFGRIGRVFYRQASSNPDFEIVAVNDLADKDNLCICWNTIRSTENFHCLKK